MNSTGLPCASAWEYLKPTWLTLSPSAKASAVWYCSRVNGSPQPRSSSAPPSRSTRPAAPRSRRYGRVARSGPSARCARAETAGRQDQRRDEQRGRSARRRPRPRSARRRPASSPAARNSGDLAGGVGQVAKLSGASRARMRRASRRRARVRRTPRQHGRDRGRLEHVAPERRPAVQPERDLDRHPDDDPARQRQRRTVPRRSTLDRAAASAHAQGGGDVHRPVLQVAEPGRAPRSPGRRSAPVRSQARWPPTRTACASSAPGSRTTAPAAPPRRRRPATGPRAARRHSQTEYTARNGHASGRPSDASTPHANAARGRPDRARSIAASTNVTIIGSDCELST